MPCPVCDQHDQVHVCHECNWLLGDRYVNGLTAATAMPNALLIARLVRQIWLGSEDANFAGLNTGDEEYARPRIIQAVSGRLAPGKANDRKPQVQSPFTESRIDADFDVVSGPVRILVELKFKTDSAQIHRGLGQCVGFGLALDGAAYACDAAVLIVVRHHGELGQPVSMQVATTARTFWIFGFPVTGNRRREGR